MRKTNTITALSLLFSSWAFYAQGSIAPFSPPVPLPAQAPPDFEHELPPLISKKIKIHACTKDFHAADLSINVKILPEETLTKTLTRKIKPVINEYSANLQKGFQKIMADIAYSDLDSERTEDLINEFNYIRGPAINSEFFEDLQNIMNDVSFEERSNVEKIIFTYMDQKTPGCGLDIK